jgi:hypothetical protein
MTENISTTPVDLPERAGLPPADSRRVRAPGPAWYRSWIPGWGLIATRHMELRKRRGLMVTAALLVLGPPALFLGLRLLFHAVDPKSFPGPAGNPGIFQIVTNMEVNFAFIIAATIGATVGTSDLSDGMFRHLVITGRSRIALYLARIPVGLAVVIPLAALAFALPCLVTSFAGVPQPTSVGVNGANLPVGLDQAQLGSWITQHPGQANEAFVGGPPGGPQSRAVRALVGRGLSSTYAQYLTSENEQLNPAVNEMVKIGLWIELDVAVAFLIGLGLASLMGQRTVPMVLLIVLQILITPLMASGVIPYFINGQRVFVGVALDQLRPFGLAAGQGTGGPGRLLFGGGGALGIPPMPTWAMITVIVGWIVAWTGLGAWRMATRDA